MCDRSLGAVSVARHAPRDRQVTCTDEENAVCSMINTVLGRIQRIYPLDSVGLSLKPVKNRKRV